MSFFAKVSARNIFRFKKRLVMTLLGISGCTALVVTGFGLRDSVLDIADLQFGKITKCHLQVFLADGANTENTEAILKKSDLVSGYAFIQSVAADFSTMAGTADGHVVIPDGRGRFDELIRLEHTTDGRTVTLTDGGAVVTQKLAELLDLHVGSTFTIDADGRYTVAVADIAENYVYHLCLYDARLL